MKMAGLSQVTGAPETKFTYNGKELEDDFNLNWYHYGARYYDPQLGRWQQVDMADEFHSPYVYVGNNPVMFIDPDGAKSDNAKNNESSSDFISRVYDDDSSYNPEGKPVFVNTYIYRHLNLLAHVQPAVRDKKLEALKISDMKKYHEDDENLYNSREGGEQLVRGQAELEVEGVKTFSPGSSGGSNHWLLDAVKLMFDIKTWMDTPGGVADDNNLDRE